jgi:hypothetical protein
MFNVIFIILFFGNPHTIPMNIVQYLSCGHQFTTRIPEVCQKCWTSLWRTSCPAGFGGRASPISWASTSMSTTGICNTLIVQLEAGSDDFNALCWCKRENTSSWMQTSEKDLIFFFFFFWKIIHLWKYKIYQVFRKQFLLQSF